MNIYSGSIMSQDAMKYKISNVIIGKSNNIIYILLHPDKSMPAISVKPTIMWTYNYQTTMFLVKSLSEGIRLTETSRTYIEIAIAKVHKEMERCMFVKSAIL